MRHHTITLALAATLALAGCGGTTTPQNGADVATANPPNRVNAQGWPEPQAADAKRWAKMFCSLNTGQTRDDVLMAMGQPTASFPDQDDWDGFGYGILVQYDENNTVISLEADAMGTMTETQKAAMPCAVE